MPIYEEQNYSIYKHRRQQLRNSLKGKYPGATGAILLLGAFENSRLRFKQDATFYYFTGIEEPGAALLINLEGEETLYLPDYKGGRSIWIAGNRELEQGNAEFFGFNAIEFLGKPCAGYSCFTHLPEDSYAYLAKTLTDVIANDGDVFTCYPLAYGQFVEQKVLLEHLNKQMSSEEAHMNVDLLSSLVDIFPVVAHMRSKKDQHELELLFQAVGITNMAHEAAASLIKPGVMEYQAQAGVEFIFTESGGSIAFPSIVASGKNGTILHYTRNDKAIEKDELVIVDIGAEYNYYCADLTRTYPANGTFSQRQRELYQIVLDTQEHIVSLAKPGIWLNNREYPDKSLHHLAIKFLNERGDYGCYMFHGIGHSLGIDVHDISVPNEPLQEGNVFTIEPGLYIAEENIGIRIEDNYWMAEDGVVCLSDELPRTPDEIEKLMRIKLS